MISRRTLMKYAGLAWLGSLFEFPDGGSEQLPTNIEGHNPWDLPFTHSLKPPWQPMREPWMPKDGQVVLLATNGGGDAIWPATFYAARNSTLHGKPLQTTWCCVTLENKNQIWPGGLGKYSWMELPSNPYRENGEWDHSALTSPPLPEPRTAEQYTKSVYYPNGRKWT